MKILYVLFSRKDVLGDQAIIGVILFAILLFLLLIKSSRDERGRAVTGRASVISMLFFITITSVVAQTFPINVNYIISANTIQFVFNSVIFVNIMCILILRKIYS